MAHVLRHCGKVARTMILSRPTTPGTITTNPQGLSTMKPLTPSGPPSTQHHQSLEMARSYATKAKTKEAKNKEDCNAPRGKIDCACARHPWPEDKKDCTKPKEKKDCAFDFKKLEVNPYDAPCDCQDPPPAAGCADVGRPKEVCCRSTRQYGCHCEEEEEESCEEEEEEEVVVKTCDLDFRKLEVNPYDEPCECHDPPPANSCEALGKKKDVCCRTPRPFGCFCEAYNTPGLDCLKQKAPPKKKEKKECNKKKYGAKCL